MSKEKEKDPAFLMYSKDWLQGTSDLMPDEKGVYIDLLCHQHQDGFIPSDLRRLARKSGLSLEEFKPLWDGIKHKFVPMPEPNGQPNGQAPLNRLVNRKLIAVITERLTKSKKNRITGTFASLIRLCDEKASITNRIKHDFDIEYFMKISDETVMERLRDWFTERLKFVKGSL